MTNKPDDKKELTEIAKSAPSKDWNETKVINMEALQALCQYKVPKKFVADHFEVSEDTIERRIKKHFNMTYGEFNKMNMARTGFNLQQKAIEMALAGNIKMLELALKNFAGWTDGREIQSETDITVNVTNYSKKAKPDIEVEAISKDEE